MLENQYQYEFREAGLRRGRPGVFGRPVFAAAVILPPDFHDPLLNDSKQMTGAEPGQAPLIIEREARGLGRRGRFRSPSTRSTS